MSVEASRILLTGGSGRLGTELRALLEGVVAPDEKEMDITDPASIAAWLDKVAPAVLVHAAAYTDVAGAETTGKDACWRINVEGTRNLVRAVIERDIFLVHISTDYVFDGVRGGYKEDDTPGPVRNYYSLTKLVAEQLARMARRHLVIRTSFRPRQWAYPSAFADIYTSQDYVDIIAPQIALAIGHCDEVNFDTLHIATERKSVYELAQRRKPDVQKGSKADVKVSLPDDISLDVSRWQTVKEKLQIANWDL